MLSGKLFELERSANVLHNSSALRFLVGVARGSSLASADHLDALQEIFAVCLVIEGFRPFDPRLRFGFLTCFAMYVDGFRLIVLL